MRKRREEGEGGEDCAGGGGEEGGEEGLEEGLEEGEPEGEGLPECAEGLLR